MKGRHQLFTTIYSIIIITTNHICYIEELTTEGNFRDPSVTEKIQFSDREVQTGTGTT